MDEQMRCAFIHTQVACAMAEIAAMQAANLSSIGARYTWDDFMAIQDKYIIGHNTVISYLTEGVVR